MMINTLGGFSYNRDVYNREYFGTYWDSEVLKNTSGHICTALLKNPASLSLAIADREDSDAIPSRVGTLG